MRERATDTDLSSKYDARSIEQLVWERWDAAKPFAAGRRHEAKPYVIMMPLPNVTGALHMGHAMDNVMQDLLTRWHRAQGDDVLWQPGTDHAGIATQAVVERRLFQLEGKTRHDIGRTELLRRIWAWKDEYQTRIVDQQKKMGCGCDWDRQRFTMDAVCSSAVREAFFRMFKDGLIYRGDRLVNWDCELLTAVADDEIGKKPTNGLFYYLKYPVIDPRPGEPQFVIVATMRPETMLGDTAVACHPDPATALQNAIHDAQKRLRKAARKQRAEYEREIERLQARVESHLPLLERLAAMARDGRMIRLPLREREIPLIADSWAKPDFGSGCVKITPAHDFDDYAVSGRHSDRVAVVNILNKDGTLNDEAGVYRGLDRFAARDVIVKDLDALGLLEKTEQRAVELEVSDRSGTVIEPFLSKQWFVRMGDLPGGLALGREQGVSLHADGLAQVAIDAANGTWRSPSGRQLRFHPDERYRQMYEDWLKKKRDWCISRQLWWGHQIPVWHTGFDTLDELLRVAQKLPEDPNLVHVWIGEASGAQHPLNAPPEWAWKQRAGPAGKPDVKPFELQVCLRNETADLKYGVAIQALGLERDPDVLDTWFSSALWPFSTLGWPDPASARIDTGQTQLGATSERASSLDRFYPGSCLVTGRDIVTLWVARMVMLGLYAMGDLPFTDVFVHANIQDGKGVRMSKSKGNGIDPLDIIASHGADAMRYVLCEMQTGSQDIKIPVQAISPFSHKERLIDLTTATPVENRLGQYIDPETGTAFDVIGTWDQEGVPKARTTSDRFDVGRNFCTKLWNAGRFVLSYVSAVGRLDHHPLTVHELSDEDRWLLSRLSAAIQGVTASLAAYNPSQAVGVARELFWRELCDWYLELVKPRLKDEATAPVCHQMLAATLDQVLRLFHPVLPFITEELWRLLNSVAPVRGIDRVFEGLTPLLVSSSWPEARSDWRNGELETEIDRMQRVTTAIRDLRASYSIVHAKPLDAVIRAAGKEAASLLRLRHHMLRLANLSSLTIAEEVQRPRNAATTVLADAEIFLADLVDPVKEKLRLEKQLDQTVRKLADLEQRLSNPSFIEKAPAGIRTAEQARLTDLEAQVVALKESLNALS